MIVVLLSACLENSLVADASATNEDGAADSEFATTATDPSEDTAVPATPGWYALDAVLSVEGGLPVTTSAAAILTVVGDDGAEALCELPLDVSGLLAGARSGAQADGVDLWWTLPVVAEEDPCAVLPGTLELGLGELVPDVRATLGRDGLLAVADALYGAYVRPDAGDVWSFGWAGTESDLAGDAEATRPVPDGTYLLATAYLVPLPDQGD